VKRVAWLLGCWVAVACTTARDPGVSSTPDAAWTAPASAVPPPIPKPAAADLGDLDMARAIDLALQNNPDTRASWLQARQAQDVVGSRRSAYYPEVDLNASYTRSRQATQGGRTIFNSTTFGPQVVLTYLLFDFGGRAAQVEEARQALIAADFTHNQQIQNVILQTEQRQNVLVVPLNRHLAWMTEKFIRLVGVHASSSGGVVSLSGFAVEMAKDVAKSLHVDLEYVETSFKTVVLDIQSGKCQVFFGFNATPERALAIDFAGPLYTLGFGALDRPGFVPKGDHWADLNDSSIRVCYAVGNSSEQQIKRFAPKSTQVALPKSDDCALAIMSGRADRYIDGVMGAMGARAKRTTGAAGAAG